MATGPRYRVQFRRRRQGKTDYRYRLRLLKSGSARAVVRNSLRQTRVQIIKFDLTGDQVMIAGSSSELLKFGWKGTVSNTPSAYLTGYLTGLRAKGKGIEEAVLDIGLANPSKGSKVFASLKGMLDAGVQIPHSEGILPNMVRIQGSHIPNRGEEISALFETVKAKIEEGHS